MPTILCEIDPCDPCDPNGSLKYSYIYTHGGQILAQQAYNTGAEPNEPNDLYFYIHDRLGSVRLVISDAADVNNSYTYSPSGEMFPSECNETVYNPFLFTGQWWDPEIQQYYLRARMYSPYLGIFTSRDPVMGKLTAPMTLHVYLYCLNEPINRIDTSGEWSLIGWFMGEPDWEPSGEEKRQLWGEFFSGLNAGTQIYLNEISFGLTDYLGLTGASQKIKKLGDVGKWSKWAAKTSKYCFIAAIGMKTLGWNVRIMHHTHAGHGGAHLQINWWTKGVEGSGGVWRWVYPW